MKSLTGQNSQKEKMALERQLAKKPADKQTYLDLEKTWEMTSPGPVEVFPDINEEWERFRQCRKRIAPATRFVTRPVSGMRHIFPDALVKHRIAATAGLAAAAVILILLVRYNTISARAFREIQTQNRNTARVILPDGSSVRLNHGTLLRFPKKFPDTERRIILSGEAFFDVVPDSSRPFLVVTENARTRVLGTKFNVWARRNETRVIVQEGKVRFSSKSNQKQFVDLMANESSSISKTLPPRTPSRQDAEYVLGWLNGRLVFEQSSVEDVLDELERAYDIEIETAGIHFGNRSMTAVFEKTDIETILDAVCLTLGINYRFTDGVYVIFSGDIAGNVPPGIPGTHPSQPGGGLL